MPQITSQMLESINQQNLIHIVEQSGVKLTKKGASYMGLCPFHNDKNPSLSVTKQGNKWIWKCFGCGVGGNAISYVKMKENVGFMDAVKRLVRTPLSTVHSKNQNQNQDKNKPEESRAVSLVSLSLLEKVMSYYERVLQDHAVGKEYLRSRGLKNPEIYSHFRIGYSDGTIPIPEDMRKELEDAGIISRQGVEIFRGCCVFGIRDCNNNVVGLYGRRAVLGKEDSPIRHLYLKGTHHGVFNAQAFKVSKKIYLTESIIDALSLYEIGIREVVALYGTNGLTQDHLQYMKDSGTQEVVLCLDNDSAGENARTRIAERLHQELGIQCSYVTLGEGIKDLNDWLCAGTLSKEELNSSVVAYEHKKENPSCSESTQGYAVQTEEGEYTFALREGIRYRVKGIELEKVHSMRMNLRVSCSEGMHIDTFDLYSSRARDQFSKMSVKLLNLDYALIHQDLHTLINELEKVKSQNLKQKPAVQEKIEIMNPEDREEAIKSLQDKNLFTRILTDFHRCGYVGEDQNLLMGYLVATSRKLHTPLSMMVISRSAAGKTSLQDSILSFMPEEDVIKYTRITGQSLFYHEENALFEKVLAIEEEAGAKEAGYGIRNVLTSKYLRTGSTIKDPKTGKLKNQETKVKINTSVFVTSTQKDVDYETLNRFIVATIDESREQTERILTYQRKLYGQNGYLLRKEKHKIMRLHQNIQRVLCAIDIINPYQEELTFTAHTLRARREQIKYLMLINVIAFTRQYQKDKKQREDGSEYIEVDTEDIALANRFAKEFLVKNLDCISPPARTLYTFMKKLVKELAKKTKTQENTVIFTRRQLMEYTGWSEWQIRAHMKELEELEYVHTVLGKQGRRYRYQLTEDITYEIPKMSLGLRELETDPKKSEEKEKTL